MKWEVHTVVYNINDLNLRTIRADDRAISSEIIECSLSKVENGALCFYTKGNLVRVFSAGHWVTVILIEEVSSK